MRIEGIEVAVDSDPAPPAGRRGGPDQDLSPHRAQILIMAPSTGRG
jgi:hypothetical protein